MRRGEENMSNDNKQENDSPVQQEQPPSEPIPTTHTNISDIDHIATESSNSSETVVPISTPSSEISEMETDSSQEPVASPGPSSDVEVILSDSDSENSSTLSEEEVHQVGLEKIKQLEHVIYSYYNQGWLKDDQSVKRDQYIDNLNKINQQIQQQKITFTEEIQKAIEDKEAQLNAINSYFKNNADQLSEEFIPIESDGGLSKSTKPVVPPKATPLQDIPKDKINYLFYDDQNDLTSDWILTGKKEGGAVKPAEYTGFYAHKENQEEYKVFIKQDTAHPENDYVEYVLSRIMRDIAEEINLDPKLIAQIELIHTHKDDIKNSISKEKKVYIASGFFKNYLDLWRDAYLAFFTLEKYQTARDNFFKIHPKFKPTFPKGRPLFYENDEIINYVISNGRYKSYQHIKELSRSMREVDTHFENIGVTTGQYTEKNKCHPVIFNKTTREITPIKEEDVNQFSTEDYKVYWVFEDVDACRIDLGAGLGDERNTFKEVKYSDNPFYNLMKFRPTGGPPPQFMQGPKELEDSEDRLKILSRIASLSEEFLTDAFQSAALEANRYFGEDISRRVAIKKLGMSPDVVNNLDANLISSMSNFFANTFIENQATPIKELIKSKLIGLPYSTSTRDAIEANLNRKISVKPSLKRQKIKWESLLTTLNQTCQKHCDAINHSKANSLENDLDTTFLKDLNEIKAANDNKISTINQLISIEESDFNEIEEFIQTQTKRLETLIHYYEIKKQDLSNLNYCISLITQLTDSSYQNQLKVITDLIANKMNQNLEEKNNIGLLRSFIQLSTSLTSFVSISKAYDDERNDINKFSDQAISLLYRFVADENCNESIVLSVDQLIKELFEYREAIQNNPKFNSRCDKLLKYQYDKITILLESALNKDDGHKKNIDNYIENLKYSTNLVANLTALNKNINKIQAERKTNKNNSLINDKEFKKLINSGKDSYVEGSLLARRCLTDPKTSLNDLYLLTKSVGSTNSIMTCATSNETAKIKELPHHIEVLKEKSVEQIQTGRTNARKYIGISLAVAGIAIAITCGLFFKLGITIPIAFWGVKLAIEGLALAGICAGGALTGAAGIGLFASSRHQPITKRVLNVADKANNFYKRVEHSLPTSKRRDSQEAIEPPPQPARADKP